MHWRYRLQLLRIAFLTISPLLHWEIVTKLWTSQIQSWRRATTLYLRMHSVRGFLIVKSIVTICQIWDYCKDLPSVIYYFWGRLNFLGDQTFMPPSLRARFSIPKRPVKAWGRASCRWWLNSGVPMTISTNSRRPNAPLDHHQCNPGLFTPHSIRRLPCTIKADCGCVCMITSTLFVTVRPRLKLRFFCQQIHKSYRSLCAFVCTVYETVTENKCLLDDFIYL